MAKTEKGYENGVILPEIFSPLFQYNTEVGGVRLRLGKLTPIPVPASKSRRLSLRVRLRLASKY